MAQIDEGQVGREHVAPIKSYVHADEEEVTALIVQVPGRDQTLVVNEWPFLTDDIRVQQALTIDPAVAEDEVTPQQEEEVKALREQELEKLETGAEEVEVEVTEAAMRLAVDNKVDLTQVEGTGVKGRIVESDVEGYLEELAEQQERDEAEKLDRYMGGPVEHDQQENAGDQQDA